MAAYMVGTPSKTVTLSRCVMSSALAGSNLGSSVSVAAFATEAFSPQVSPNTWNSGRQPMTTLSGVPSSSVRAVTVALPVSPSWVSSAPLGLPVVPEVYKMTASSSPCRPDGPGAAPWTWPSTSAKSAVSAAIIWGPRIGGALGGLPGGGVPGQQHLGTRVVQIIADLTLLEQRVHRHHDGADGQRAVEGDRERRDVRQHEPDAVAGLDPARGERAPIRPAASCSWAQVSTRSSIRIAGWSGWPAAALSSRKLRFAMAPSSSAATAYRNRDGSHPQACLRPRADAKISSR